MTRKKTNNFRKVLRLVFVMLPMTPIVFFAQEVLTEVTEKSIPEINIEDLKVAISNAAAVDRTTFREIAEVNGVDPVYLIKRNGETLTCHTIMITIMKKVPGKKFFIKIPESVNPRDLAEAFDYGFKGVGRVSIIHPAYIHDLKTKKIEGGIEGSLTFIAPNKAYEGSVKFLAKPIPGRPEKLFVHAFILDEEGLKLSRRSIGDKWKRSLLTAK